MTWLFHSSVAAVLLVVALASRGILPLDLGVVLVLGANVGGGIIAVMLSRAAAPKSRIVPLGNLIMRSPAVTRWPRWPPSATSSSSAYARCNTCSSTW